MEELVGHGWEVTALVRPTSDTRRLQELGVHRHSADLSDAGSYCAAVGGADTVFHLAAVTAARTEEEYRSANELGTRAVVNALREADPKPKRLVYLSSYAAAGPATDGRPRRHDSPPDPLTAYGRTKLAGEQISHQAREAGIDVVVIRAPAVYGPGDRDLLTYFRLVRLGIAPQPAGAEQRLHLVFGPDLAHALRRASSVEPGTYAIADGIEHRWSDIVRTIATALNRRPLSIPLPPAFVRTAAHITETVGRWTGRPVAFNREKAEEMLAPAWICDLSGMDLLLPASDTTPLDVGIDRTVRWYLRQGWL